jgi:DNA-binding response OmpR family regulator
LLAARRSLIRSPLKSSGLNRPTVLLVEDDPATLEAFATGLRDEFRVFVAKTADEALAVSEELDWDADILVVDLALGEGLRGDQFVERYRERAGRVTPVIVVSGAPRAYEIARMIRPQSILLKPIDLDELIGRVNLFVRPRRPRRLN